MTETVIKTAIIDGEARMLGVPTEKELRDAGYTAAAINFPMSDEAFVALCAYNGIAPDKAPRAWRYAPNAALRDRWERVAAATGGSRLDSEQLAAKSYEGEPRHPSGDACSSERPSKGISEGLRNPHAASMYPDDGGLNNPVREYSETQSVAQVLKDHYRL